MSDVTTIESGIDTGTSEEVVQTPVRTAAQQAADKMVEKFRERVEDLANEGYFLADSVLTHSAICVVSKGDKEVQWILDTGEVFATRSSHREHVRPLAAVIPSSVKKLRDIMSPDKKLLDKAKDNMREAFRGFFATLETRLARQNPSRTLPGVSGKTYSPNSELAEFQKYADAGEKVGLG